MPMDIFGYMENSAKRRSEDKLASALIEGENRREERQARREAKRDRFDMACRISAMPEDQVQRLDAAIAKAKSIEADLD